ncbi:MAG: TonB-dependent receptor [Leptothrix sp. (in: Bacteria)]|nr:TonB-dependent receptor [Leptothrix sp. (in: b-proteobacteria)]
MSIRLKSRGRVLAAACSLSLFSLPSLLFGAAASAQTTVVVTGAREPLAPERLAADVAVIAAETLRASTADSLADLLRREAGLQLSRSGGPGQSTGLMLRGTASQQSVLLVDGVRIGSATLGYAAVEALGLQLVDRVEVLRGPGSSLYGADAVGGVVQVFTPTGSAGNAVEGRAALGGYGSRELSGSVRGALGGLDYAAGLSSERSDGVSALRPGDRFGNYNPDRDGHRLDSAHLRLGLRPAAGHRVGLLLLRTRLNSQYDDSEYLPPTYAPDASADFRTRLDTEIGALDWRGTLAPGWTGSARVSRSVDDARNGGTETDAFRTTREQAAAQLAWATGRAGQLVLAVERNRDRARSSSYAEPVSRRNDAVVAELTGAAGEWSWQADLRRDDNSDFGAVTTGRLGGAWALAPGWRLRALAGSTFRAPSFNDLYYPGYGVATLQPERGRSAEVGLGWKGATGEAAATLWRNRVRELVGYESDATKCPPGYSFGCAANVNRARLQGLTLNGAQRHGAWALRAQVDFLEARDRATGARLARRAAHQATLGAEWTQAAWTVGASLLRLGERPDGGKRLAAETTLDLAATWRLAPAWRLQAKLLNATDRDLEPVRDYQGLGRQAWLVLRYVLPS